jgi:hypothetical protein
LQGLPATGWQVSKFVTESRSFIVIKNWTSSDQFDVASIFLLSSLNRNYSRRQASGLFFEAILQTQGQVLQIRQFHFVGDLRNHKLGTISQ